MKAIYLLVFILVSMLALIFGAAMAQETLLDVLSSPQCQIACFLGIEPGVTTRTELEGILEGAEITYEVDTIGRSGLTTLYVFDSNTLSPFIVNGPKSIGVLLGGDIVEQIDISLSGVTVNNVIDWYGAPVVIGNVGSNVLVYPDVGLIFFISETDSSIVNLVYLRTNAGTVGAFTDIQPCAGATSLCSIPTATPVPPTPENGPIVYVSKRNGNWEVYKMNADGTGDTRLTNYSGQDWSPSWSPDGSKIAFMSLRHHASGEIYTMNADGSNVVRLTTNTFVDVEPDYSPDGSKIVFVSVRGSTSGQLWTMNADGTGQTLLYDSAGDDNQPAWSPDGTQIAFGSNQSGNWEIWVVPATGGTATKLTNHSSMDRYPAWSADGSQIAWVSDRTGFDVYAMPATGGTATNISSHTAYDSYPAYSPDGTLMAFTSNRDGDHEVWKMTVTGASPVQLTFNTALEWDPDWVALTGGGEALLSAPAIVSEAIPDNTPKPGRLNTLPTGKSEQTHANLFYVGAWVEETVAGASVRTTNSIGGEVWFAFRGRQLTLHVVKRPDALPIEVCIDEVCQTIDLYSAQASVTSVTIGDLKAGGHTVHISNDSAGYLSLDAVEVLAR